MSYLLLPKNQVSRALTFEIFVGNFTRYGKELSLGFILGFSVVNIVER